MVGMLGVMRLRNLMRIKMDRVDPELVIEKLKNLVMFIQRTMKPKYSENEEELTNTYFD